MKTIKSSQYRKLHFVYALSESSLSRAHGEVIILDGLPSNPSDRNQLIQKLSQQNLDVFFPRYEGTWESKGEFLKRAPSKAITEFIKALRRGIVLNDKKYIAQKIFILGASFGGGVALDIASQNIANKICVVSPVISFKKVVGIDTLKNYLGAAYPKDYRFDPKNWQKLLEDGLWDLDDNKIKNSSDVLILAGDADNQIKKADILEFGKKNKIRIGIYNFGHITLGKITESMLEEILEFFSK
jgi:esterase/lipase